MGKEIKFNLTKQQMLRMAELALQLKEQIKKEDDEKKDKP